MANLTTIDYSLSHVIQGVPYNFYIRKGIKEKKARFIITKLDGTVERNEQLKKMDRAEAASLMAKFRGLTAKIDTNNYQEYIDFILASAEEIISESK